jgi:hypothetical protein
VFGAVEIVWKFSYPARPVFGRKPLSPTGITAEKPLENEWLTTFTRWNSG